MTSVSLDRRQLLLMATSTAAAVAAPSGAHPTSRWPDKSAWTRLDRLGEQLIRESAAPGLAVAVMKAGELRYTRGFGLANLETATPVSPQTVFRIGSVTKQFTGAAVAALAQNGKLSLDDTLWRFFPLFPRARQITLRQMLTHTSGLGNYTDSEIDFRRKGRLDRDETDLLADMASGARLMKFEPGSSWAYSNTAYILLGLIIQQVAEEAWGAYLQRRLFAPAGLTHTAVDDAAEVVPNRANGYSTDSTESTVLRNADFLSMSYAHAAGALRSTCADLCRWQAALLGGRILESRMLEHMITPARLADGSLPWVVPPGAGPGEPKREMRYGFGVFLNSFMGHDCIEHGGHIFGFSAHLRSFWRQQLTIAVLINCDGPQQGATARNALRDDIARVALTLD